MTGHKALLEATNAGHYFADCTCGWSGGVYYGRANARQAHSAHKDGLEVPPHVQPTVLLTPYAKESLES